MRKWIVKFFDGCNEIYRVCYAGFFSGFTVVDAMDDGEFVDCNILYQGYDREKVISLMEDTCNVTQAVIDMIRAFPVNK